MLDFLILALASWRLANLLVNESGPKNVFGRLRAWVGVETVTALTANGLKTGHAARNAVAEGFMCVWCVSVWSATFFMVSGLIPVWSDIVAFIAKLLAVSSGAIIVHEAIAYLRGSS